MFEKNIYKKRWGRDEHILKLSDQKVRNNVKFSVGTCWKMSNYLLINQQGKNWVSNFYFKKLHIFCIKETIEARRECIMTNVFIFII